MAKFIKSILLLTLLIPITLHAEDIFPESKTVQGREIVKTAETDFRWLFIKVYRGTLYTDKNAPLDQILDPRYAKELEFEYKVSISAEDFVKSGNNFLEKNLTSEELKSIQADIETINTAYKTVEEGDRYRLSYIPEKGTRLYFNDQEIAHLTHPQFAEYYFQIWLGDSPVKDSFRDKLLQR